ncbi:MAG: DUF4942 domain-containing protein [Tepidisphaeraceae bacterium]
MSTAALLTEVKAADEDFEWYPTTDRMIGVVAKRIGSEAKSIMDIGAGDGRVLIALSNACRQAAAEASPWYSTAYCENRSAAERTEAIKEAFAREKGPELFAIEKSAVLVQSQPENVTPVGTDLFEQNLACLPVDYIFCNPPYSQFEAWACNVIESGYAKIAWLVIPRRWKESKTIAASLAKRGATATVIHSDDFRDGERRARAVIDIVEIRYPRDSGSYETKPTDPFDIWFDQNIDTFDREAELEPDEFGSDLAKKFQQATIGEMVEEYNAEYALMESNYRAIFGLDLAILKELGVDKCNVREGIKKKMAGLKNKYWRILFDRLDTITSRLTTKTKSNFLDKLAGRKSIAFTNSNAYAVVLWAIKHANKYYDEQLIQLFRDLSTFDGVLNYKSNKRTWQDGDWRWSVHDSESKKPSHYALDYRVVVRAWRAIEMDWDGKPRTELAKNAADLITDVIAVFGNLGFSLGDTTPTHRRVWRSNATQAYEGSDDKPLFEVKAFQNGNLHFKFRPEAVRALNIEAGRLLGWIKDRRDVVTELGYSEADAEAYYNTSRKILPSNVRLIGTVLPDRMAV